MSDLSFLAYLNKLAGFDVRDRELVSLYLDAQKKALEDVRDMPRGLAKVTAYSQKVQEYFSELREGRQSMSKEGVRYIVMVDDLCVARASDLAGARAFEKALGEVADTMNRLLPDYHVEAQIWPFDYRLAFTSIIPREEV